MKTDGTIRAHYCIKERGQAVKMYAERTIHHVPRVGDELRFNNTEFYVVTKVLWAMDEPEYPRERCNITMEILS